VTGVYSVIAVGNYYRIFHMRSSLDTLLALKDHLLQITFYCPHARHGYLPAFILVCVVLCR
jgi:hypothetical protein